MNKQKSTKLTIDVVIPVYNEELCIPMLVKRLEELSKQIENTRVEVIFVDDHSTDNSPVLLKEACRQNEGYRYLRLSRNSGSHIAILAGLEYTRGHCAIFLAADLQDPPELIPEMLKLWRAGNHVVWAAREHREGISWFEKISANAFYWLLNRFGQISLPPRGSDFALLDRTVIESLLRSASASPSVVGEITRLGFRQTQIPYTKAKRQFGRSKWKFGRKLHALIDAFVLFSYVPLRVMSYLGVASSLFGFIYALVVISLRLLAKAPIEGWASLMVVVLVLGGLQMIMLGVLGEYLWRTLEEARQRPRYFLEDTYGFEKSEVGEGSISSKFRNDRHD
jgi:dolichol-phosphate mannosyltransferase